MIYFHIPFCKQACHYCDFHFSTSLKYKEEMLVALEKEVELRASYLENKKVKSIYFGGGTPSLLAGSEIDRLIGKVSQYFEIDADAEITLEANPDDLDSKKVKEFKTSPINRFSIGIQSFFQEDLLWMNRAHNAQEADSSIKRVQDAGFENITCDLIYGYPLLTDQKWNSNIQKLLDFGIPHISAYSMTVEHKTALADFIKKGKAAPMSEEQSASQFEILTQKLTENNFEHYEISNFAKNGMYAKHNTNYWKGNYYLGIGPSAHSFNGNSRSWNVANNSKYINGISTKNPDLETEILSKEDQINEYIMTSLRTMWGIDLQKFQQLFGTEISNQLLVMSEGFKDNGDISISDNTIKLTKKGKLIADLIASELFFLQADF